MTRRLPSFNDFSPGIFSDIRGPLLAVEAASGDREKAIEAISSINHWPIANKRAKNVLITLQHTGMVDKSTTLLTPAGISIAKAESVDAAVERFCKNLLEKQNGLLVIDAVRGLNKRAERITKRTLKLELERIGVTDLSNATTDHLSVSNWMVAAGVLNREKDGYSVNDDALKKLVGITSEEVAELEGLEVPQRIFTLILRRIVITEGTNWISAGRIISECLRDYPRIFVEDQMRRKVLSPLEELGWISTMGGSGGRGAKSGKVRAEPKLRNIPIKYVVPTFDTAVPPDLRQKIDTPLTKIRDMLRSSSKHERGLGLELLVLRMILDLALIPRGFRKRAKSTGFAEVDVTAEGAHLLFSRWMFQCKAIDPRSNVDNEDVAREVGIAIHAKAHVVAMVSLGGFTRYARDFAREIAATTQLQFLFIEGRVVREYLETGAPKLVDHVLTNAKDVMAQKEDQLPIEIRGGVEFEEAQAIYEAGEAAAEKKLL